MEIITTIGHKRIHVWQFQIKIKLFHTKYQPHNTILFTTFIDSGLTCWHERTGFKTKINTCDWTYDCGNSNDFLLLPQLWNILIKNVKFMTVFFIWLNLHKVLSKQHNCCLGEWVLKDKKNRKKNKFHII